MKQSLESFILQIPYSMLRKVLYIYIGAVLFWKSAPVVSLTFWTIILTTLSLIGYQSFIRKSRIIKAHTSGEKEYIETLRAPVEFWGPRLLLVLVAAAVTGYLLKGPFGLSGVHIFSLIVGYPLFYRETLLLGAYVAYIVTNRGIGIEYIPGHSVYQAFIGFDEIKSINIIQDRVASPTWSFLTPLSEEDQGLLLVPSNPEGFSARDQAFFITPKDVPSFLSHLPASVKVIGA